MRDRVNAGHITNTKLMRVLNVLMMLFCLPYNMMMRLDPNSKC